MEFQSEYPLIKRFVDLAGNAQKQGTLMAEMDPRMVVAGIIALVFGLRTFGEYVFSATGLDNEPSDVVEDKILYSWRSLLKP